MQHNRLIAQTLLAAMLAGMTACGDSQTGG